MNKNNQKNQKTKRTKTKEESKIVRKRTSRIIIGVVSALALVFLVFIFVTTNFMGSDNLVVETTQRISVADTINTTGFVFREETYIDKNTDGFLVYQVSDGDKVTANGIIASVYNSEDEAIVYQKICDIDEEINDLKSLNNISNSVNIGLDTVNNQLDDRLVSFIDYINERNFDGITPIENELLSSIYRKQIITGDQDSFDDTIAELESEKSILEDKPHDSTGNIVTKKSGYFVSSIDGYESYISVDDMSQIKYSDLLDPKADKVDNSIYAGKIINGFSWYVACPVTNEEAVAINHSNSNVSVRISNAYNEPIPAKVVSVNQFANEDKSVVVLECSYMNSALAKVRNETVEIELNTYEGLKVSKNALHDDFITKTITNENGETKTEESKVQGVYVKYGSELIFKQVYIIYSGDDYVICSETPSEDLLYNGTTISLYDEVVVEGDDLYDGKLID